MEAPALRRQRAAVLPGSRRLLGALGDDRLVDQVRRGNSVAFEVVYDRHYRGILSFCRHMLGSRDEAEDAVQQTFASAFTDLQSNQRDIRLKAWLYAIARNRCLSMLRARREQPAELDEMATAGLSEQVQQRADLRELLHDLRELPAEQREALVLFELGDLSQAEVADVIGVEPVKVKALVFQARSSLIENREARTIPCAEIREQLATASGGALRRGPLRRHLNACDGCREYRDHVRAQRRALAVVLPVVPTAGLKDSILGAFGGGAGGAGVATGGAAGGAALGGSGAAGGGGLFGAVGGLGVAKVAVATTLGLGAVTGGGVAIKAGTSDGGAASVQAAEESGGANGASQSSGGDGDPAAAVLVDERGARAGEREAKEDGEDGDKAARDEKPERGDKGKRERGDKGKRGRGGGKGRSRGRGSRDGGRSGARGHSGSRGNGGGHARGPRPGAQNGGGNGGGRSGSRPERPPRSGLGGRRGSGTRGGPVDPPAIPAPVDPTTTKGERDNVPAVPAVPAVPPKAGGAAGPGERNVPAGVPAAE